jgi:hypothetical protein
MRDERDRDAKFRRFSSAGSYRGTVLTQEFLTCAK